MLSTKAPKRQRFVGNDRMQLLPEGSLACRSCGIAVVTYTDTLIEKLTVYGRRGLNGVGYDTEIGVTRCDRCADRLDVAARIMGAHPAVAREHGNVGIDRLDAALAALDVMERSTLTESLTLTDAYLRNLIAALSALGGWCSWSATSAAPGVCAPRRWAHVSQAMWDDTRREFAALLQRRMERPEPIGPPTDRGALPACAFCGVGTLLLKKSAAAAAWGVEHRMPLASMGGWGGEVVTAHVCPTCRAALVSSGAIGLPAVWLAVIRSRGYEPRSSSGVVSLDGVKPWAALPRGAEPNATPWAQVDLAALDRELAFTIHVRKAEAA